jgi:hypothetical protein
MTSPEVIEEQARWAAVEQMAAEELERQRALEELAIALAPIIDNGQGMAQLGRGGAGLGARPSTPVGKMEGEEEEGTSHA